MLKRFRFRSKFLVFLVSIILPIALAWGCSSILPGKQSSLPVNQTSTSFTQSNALNSKAATLATEVARGIIAACPIADPGDDNARNLCAENLSKLESLRNAVGKEVLWGGQKEPGKYALKENHTTSFDPLVWRRTYLSTFMFSGEPKVEQKDDLTVVRLPVQFRNKLDVGAFPYPFWHSHRKWTSYQQAKEILLVMKDGELKGALRSADKDPQRPLVEHEWDGQWSWENASGQQEPQVVLYKYLFSNSNPHVKALDATYRAFEVEMREHSCNICHSPHNANEMNPLLLLNYPNQALTLRHETLRQIKEKLMPPPNGIPDDAERLKMVKLAEAFAKIGDQALAYEGEKSASAKPSKPSDPS